MSPQATRDYLATAAVYARQLRSKAEKSKFLDHLVAITRLSRKHLIRTLKRDPEQLKKPSKTGRPKIYDYDALGPHIALIWECTDRICAERLHAALPEWLSHYEHPDLLPHLRAQAVKMSPSSLERFLHDLRLADPVRGLSTTRPSGSRLMSQVPIATLDASIKAPGYVQCDTVAHCGTSTAGSYVSSLTMTDVFTTWTVNLALEAKTATQTSAAMKRAALQFPFKVDTFQTDSGSEFINGSVIALTQEVSIALTRSRPYKKNDNCFVEQKNFTHVRQLFGYQRIEGADATREMNEIFDLWNKFQNHFVPNQKLEFKARMGSKIKKRMGRAHTPYRRVIGDSRVPDSIKHVLVQQHKALNPFQLKAEIEQKLAHFFKSQRVQNVPDISLKSAA